MSNFRSEQKTARGAGNTKLRQEKFAKLTRRKDWCLTFWDTDDWDFVVDYWNDEGKIMGRIEYLIGQLEQCPETDRFHMQAYIEFAGKGVDFFNVKQLCGKKTHISPRYGPRIKARDYCRKDESRIDGPFEFGEFDDSRQGQRSELIDCKIQLEDGKSIDDLWNTNFCTMARYGKGLQDFAKAKVANSISNKHKFINKKVYYLYGSGDKREEAYNIIGDSNDIYYCYGDLGRLTNYKGEKNVIIELDSMKTDIKDVINLCDKHIHYVDIMYGRLPFLAENVILIADDENKKKNFRFYFKDLLKKLDKLITEEVEVIDPSEVTG